MEKVPQIVSERLKAAAPPVEHPDAELITAFSERSLPPAERNTVLEHLACCGDCREIVALALPASEPDQQIAHPAHEHGGWLTWPVLRWGLIAAGLLAITSFGVMQNQRRSSMTAFNARRPEAASKITNAPPILPPSSQAAEDQAKLRLQPQSSRGICFPRTPDLLPQRKPPLLCRPSAKLEQATRLEWAGHARNRSKTPHSLTPGGQHRHPGSGEPAHRPAANPGRGRPFED